MISLKCCSFFFLITPRPPRSKRTDTRFPYTTRVRAYQIEGSPLADGAGASIWQRFSHDPRLMAAKGATGDIACDHYNRMESDVALMKEIGLNDYRFSVDWGRVLPEGKLGRASCRERAGPSG